MWTKKILAVIRKIRYASPTRGLSWWVCAWVADWHPQTMVLERRRIYLRCLVCGRESTGWDVTPTIVRSRPRLVRFQHRLRRSA
jgi:hypothetical protein